VQAWRVLRQLLGQGKVPAALCLDHDVRALGVDLDVGVPGVGHELLQPDRAYGAWLRAADEGEQRSCESIAARERPTNGERDVVLLVAEQVEDRVGLAAVQKQVSHNSVFASRVRDDLGSLAAGEECRICQGRTTRVGTPTANRSTTVIGGRTPYPRQRRRP
jgi:hypothetical protein